MTRVLLYSSLQESNSLAALAEGVPEAAPICSGAAASPEVAVVSAESSLMHSPFGTDSTLVRS